MSPNHWAVRNWRNETRTLVSSDVVKALTESPERVATIMAKFVEIVGSVARFSVKRMDGAVSADVNDVITSFTSHRARLIEQHVRREALDVGAFWSAVEIAVSDAVAAMVSAETADEVLEAVMDASDEIHMYLVGQGLVAAAYLDDEAKLVQAEDADRAGDPDVNVAPDRDLALAA